MNLFNKNLYCKNFLIFFYLVHALSFLKPPGSHEAWGPKGPGNPRGLGTQTSARGTQRPGNLGDLGAQSPGAHKSWAPNRPENPQPQPLRAQKTWECPGGPEDLGAQKACEFRKSGNPGDLGSWGAGVPKRPGRLGDAGNTQKKSLGTKHADRSRRLEYPRGLETQKGLGARGAWEPRELLQKGRGKADTVENNPMLVDWGNGHWEPRTARNLNSGDLGTQQTWKTWELRRPWARRRPWN